MENDDGNRVARTSSASFSPNAREIKAFAARQSQLLSGRIVAGEKRLPRFLVKVTALEYFDYA